MSDRVGGTSTDRIDALSAAWLSSAVGEPFLRTASAFFVRISLKLCLVSFLPNVSLNFAMEDDTEEDFVTTSPCSLFSDPSFSACKLFCRSNARFFRSIGEINDVRCTTSTRCFSESVIEISLFSSSTAAAAAAVAAPPTILGLLSSCSFFLSSASNFSCWRRFRSAGEINELKDDRFLAFCASSSVSSSLSLPEDDGAGSVKPSCVGESL